MKRGLLILMAGAALLSASDLEAQRARQRGNDEAREGRRGRVERLEPVRAPGRVAPRPTYRTPDRRHRVVYSSGVRYPAYARGHAWVRVDWGRVGFDRRAFQPRGRAFLNQGELRRIIGRDGVRMARNAGRRAGLRGGLRGHWIQQGWTSTLIVRMDGFDVAEFVDFDSDGFIDDVFLIGPAGGRRAAYGW